MNVKAHEIKHALSKKHWDDFFLTEVKNGPTQLAKSGELAIMDALAVKKSWVKPCITGYEVKVSRQDFLNDSKWPAYKNMCHRFYFACPKGLIQPDELPDDVGLIWFNPETNSLYTRKKSKFRDIEMPADMFYYIIMNRLENVKHPFFTSKREYFEEYLNDKVSSRKLGMMVKSKMINNMAEFDKEKVELQRKVDQLKNETELLNKIKEQMRKHGLRTGNWMIEDELERALSSSLPPNFLDKLQTIKNTSDQLYKLAGSK